MSNSSEQAYHDLRQQLEIGCPAFIPGVDTSYSYVPSLAAGIVFCVLFGLGLVGHTVQFARLRRWTSILMGIGALTELIGWAGRTWSAECPYSGDAFLMQITTLIIAPVFFSAALYVLLGILIIEMGRHTSILSPKWYSIVFCTCDLISLVLQAIGGAMASTGSDKLNGDTETGTHIMVGGIGFQLATMTLFALFFIDFLRRIRAAPAPVPRRIKLVLVSMVISFVMIYIRSVYRTVELAQGWSGYLITHEPYFIALDAAIMVVSVVTFLVLDPAVLLSSATKMSSLEAQHSSWIPMQRREKTPNTASESDTAF